MKNLLKTVTAIPVIGLLLLAGGTPAYAAPGDVNPETDKCFIDLDVTEEQLNDPDFLNQDFSPYLICEAIPTPEPYNDLDLGITPTITDADRIYYYNANGTASSNLQSYTPANIVTEGGVIVGTDRPEFIYNTFNNGDIASLPVDVELDLERNISNPDGVETNTVIGVEVKTLNKTEWVNNEPNASGFYGLENIDTNGVTTKLVEDGKTIPADITLPVFNAETGFYSTGSISLTLPSMNSILTKEDGSLTVSYDFVVTVYEQDLQGEIVTTNRYYTIEGSNIANCDISGGTGEIGGCIGGTGFTASSVGAYYTDEEVRPYTANVFVDANGDGVRNNNEGLYTGADFDINGVPVVDGVLTGTQKIMFSYSETEGRMPLYSGSDFFVSSFPEEYTLTTVNSLPFFNTLPDGSFDTAYVAEFGIQLIEEEPPVVEPPVVVPPVVIPPVLVEPPVEPTPVVNPPSVVVPPAVIKNGGEDISSVVWLVAGGVLILGGVAALVVISKSRKNALTDEEDEIEEEK